MTYMIRDQKSEVSRFRVLNQYVPGTISEKDMKSTKIMIYHRKLLLPVTSIQLYKRKCKPKIEEYKKKI